MADSMGSFGVSGILPGLKGFRVWVPSQIFDVLLHVVSELVREK